MELARSSLPNIQISYAMIGSGKSVYFIISVADVSNLISRDSVKTKTKIP